MVSRLWNPASYATGLMLATFLLAASLFAASAWAGPVREVDLYTVELPAESRAAQERASLASRALREVFVRCTGNREADRHYPALGRELAGANRHVARYQYQLRKNNNASNRRKETLFVSLSFEPGTVQRILASAGAPFWQAQRPEVLVTAVDRSRYVDPIEAESQLQEIRRLLQARASQRGIPLRVQLEQGTAASGHAGIATPRGVWALQGDIAQSSSGYRTSWTVVEPGGIQPRYYSVPQAAGRGSLAAVLDNGIDAVADSLAQRFAVADRDDPLAARSTVEIRGVSSRQDYLRLQELLRGIKALAGLQLDLVTGDQLIYQLPRAVDANKLRSLLTLDGQLVAIGTDGELVFDWRG